MVSAATPLSLPSRVLPLGLLAAAGFLSSAGARAVDPLLALIAQDFATSVSAVSVVLAAFTVSYGVFQLVLGPLSDRCGKLRLILLALIGYMAFTGACALASGITSLTILRACSGAASAGLIPICLAYIGDTVAYDRRQLTLSRFLVGVMLAQTVAGPLSGGFGQYIGWRGVFLLLAAIALVLVVVLRLQLAGVPDRLGSCTFTRANYAVLAREPAARFLLLATLVEGSFVAAIVPFIAPYLNEVFQLSYASAGLVLACFGIGALAFGRIAPLLVPSLGESGMVLAGAGLMAAAALAAAAARSWMVLIPVEFSLGLGYFMLHTVLQARATELLPDARSTAVSSFVFMLFTGQSLGALASGLAIGWGGYPVAFGADSSLLALLGIVLWASFRPRSA